MRVSILGPGDETPLEAFLAPHAESSMFLRSNARAGGLVDEGKPYQATYAAVWEDGAIVAVAAHCWNGFVLVQAPALGHVGLVAHAAVERSGGSAPRRGDPGELPPKGRAVSGISGPWAQVQQARAALDMASRPAALDEKEDLFALRLDELHPPETLQKKGWICRPLEKHDVIRATAWRVAYSIETLGKQPSESLEIEARHAIETWPSQWVLEVPGEGVVAYSAFNARLPDMVQVGGVYTPPPWRGRGYAQAVVGGSLLAARAEGVVRSILFTKESNAPACAAYARLGFQIIGDYGLILF